MITHHLRRYVTGFLGLCLTVFTVWSCTKDYFVDENNFLLYVPQIEDGSIQNFYVALHAEDGSHTITRELTAPFDKDEKMTQGILRFKVLGGRNYSISCFANYAPGSIAVGNHYEETYKTKELDQSRTDPHAADGNVYYSRTTSPRSLFTSAMAYPVGHPDSQIPYEIDIDETRLFKGNIVLSFIDLPSQISRIDTYYSGLSTAYHIDGTFRYYTDDDRIRGSYSTAGNLSGNTVTVSDRINPSAGTEFGRVADAPHRSRAATRGGVRSDVVLPLEMEIYLYDNDGNSLGMIPFTQADFDSLANDKKPVDENGDPVTTLELWSQETIKFTFKGFTLIGIELVGWGDIIDGPTTPM